MIRFIPAVKLIYKKIISIVLIATPLRIYQDKFGNQIF